MVLLLGLSMEKVKWLGGCVGESKREVI
ncbi:hypothetical protein A2U01_0026203, partial [Trifolium medium]|nr:hypothetical protein [Trifolium medium]